MNTQSILPILQMILAMMNICVLGYAFANFLKKPHDTLEQRVTSLESWKRETDIILNMGKEHITDQDDTNQVLIHSVLALIEFEIQYCLTEHKEMSKDLEKAKEDLHSFLSKR